MSELQGGAMERTTDWTELAIRERDGLAVSLLWSRSADLVKVNVADAKLDEDFEFVVDGAQALAAFYHPFAYAAGQGLSFVCAAPASLDLQPQN
jgi:hypothetical protein